MEYESSIFVFNVKMKNKNLNTEASVYKRKVIRVYVVKIFFWSRGRNAWYGTWVRNFYPGMSLHKTIEDAKEFSEKERKQGSVFYIDELPALIFEMEGGVGILVTQINTETPFSDLKFNEIGNYIKKKSYLTFEDIENVFNAYSVYWKRTPSTENSLIKVYLYNVSDFINLDRQRLKSFYSQSFGKNYLLDWYQDKDYKVSIININKIYKIFSKTIIYSDGKN